MTGYFEQNRREIAAREWERAPDVPAVFLIRAREGAPYLARTGVLRRRLARILKQREQPHRFLNLRDVAETVEWYPTASRLESSYILYRLARIHHPGNYEKIARLRWPAYVKLTQSNAFPRTTITIRLGGSRSSYYGPFRNRAAAEAFESQMLELFQIRRCQEDLEPRPEHPGCIYGEMNMCLRPCQQVVGPEEYRSEVARVYDFLASGGRSLKESAIAARDRLSDEMQFEAAAREHKRVEKIDEVLKLRDELARDVNYLFGVAVTPAHNGGAVLLWFHEGGLWHEPRAFSLAVEGGRPVSLDHQLRELIDALPAARGYGSERQEHLALLSNWFYSSWRDGQWIPAESRSAIPYRRLVNAIAKVARRENDAAGKQVGT